METISSTPWFETAAIVVAVCALIVAFFTLRVSRRQTAIQATALTEGKRFTRSQEHAAFAKKILDIKDRTNEDLAPVRLVAHKKANELLSLFNSYEEERSFSDPIGRRVWLSCEEIADALIVQSNDKGFAYWHFEFLIGRDQGNLYNPESFMSGFTSFVNSIKNTDDSDWSLDSISVQDVEKFFPATEYLAKKIDNTCPKSKLEKIISDLAEKLHPDYSISLLGCIPKLLKSQKEARDVLRLNKRQEFEMSDKLRLEYEQTVRMLSFLCDCQMNGTIYNEEGEENALSTLGFYKDGSTLGQLLYAGVILFILSKKPFELN